MEENTNFQKTTPPEQKRTGLMVFLGFLAGALLATLVTGAVFILRDKNQAATPVVEESSENATSEVISEKTLKKIEWIRDTLDSSFLFGTEDHDFESGLIKGYVDSLDDPYTVYYTKDEYQSLMESTSGTYSGIGVVVTQNAETGVVTVVNPYEGAPGAEAGMLPEDVIYKIEDEEITGMDLSIAVSKIKGEEGTSVKVTVYRPSTNKYIDMDIVRRKIEIQTISHEMLENQIGYIKMDSFEDVTYKQFMAAYDELNSQGMKALIVDIRNNGGGLLTSVVDILNQLLPEGIITYTEDKDGKRQEYTSDAKSVLDMPMAVLVNGNSASASEIFTGALQDYGVATIVGTQTFGKGIVQHILPMLDGTALKVTVSRYYTPNGVCIHGVGITPDIEVELDDSVTSIVTIPHDQDNQLQEAIKAVSEKMK